MFIMAIEMKQPTSFCSTTGWQFFRTVILNEVEKFKRSGKTLSLLAVLVEPSFRIVAIASRVAAVITLWTVQPWSLPALAIFDKSSELITLVTRLLLLT